METHIYTDGGCTGNPGPGGWSAVILMDGTEPIEISGGEVSTTNNRMELAAVIHGLKRVIDLNTDPGDIEVHTDSQYVQRGISEWLPNWIRKGWKTARKNPVKNKDLWMQLNELNDTLNTKWTWIRGHVGDRWNERCDELVARERARFQN